TGQRSTPASGSPAGRAGRTAPASAGTASRWSRPRARSVRTRRYRRGTGTRGGAGKELDPLLRWGWRGVTAYRAGPRRPGSRRPAGAPTRRHRQGAGGDRQDDRERGLLTGPAAGADGAAVVGDDLPGDGQPQAAAAGAASTRGVGAPEPVEDVGELLRRDSVAVVG